MDNMNILMALLRFALSKVTPTSFQRFPAISLHNRGMLWHRTGSFVRSSHKHQHHPFGKYAKHAHPWSRLLPCNAQRHLPSFLHHAPSVCGGCCLNAICGGGEITRWMMLLVASSKFALLLGYCFALLCADDRLSKTSRGLLS